MRRATSFRARTVSSSLVEDGSAFFTELLHYVRTGAFVGNLLAAAHDGNEYAFGLGALAHWVADTTGHPEATNRVDYAPITRIVDGIAGGGDPIAQRVGLGVALVAAQRPPFAHERGYRPRQRHEDRPDSRSLLVTLSPYLLI